jgi:GT2 family glycosyltransferase
VTDTEIVVDPLRAPRRVWIGSTLVELDEEGRPVAADRAATNPGLVAAATRELELGRWLAELSSRGPEARRAGLAALVELAGDDRAACEDLSRAREALRDRHRVAVISPQGTDGVQVEALVRLDRRHWLVQGWIARSSDELRSLAILSPLGHRIPLDSSAARYARADVDQFLGRPPRRGAGGAGFVALVEAPHPCPPSGFLVEIEPLDGRTVEAPCPDAVTDHDVAREVVMGLQQLDRLGEDSLTRTVVHPAVQLLERERRCGVELDTVDELGAAPEEPAVTVVVPLYGRLDFLELQLAQWVLDPAMRECQLVYVLDQPEHAEQLRAEARRLSRLYDQPFVLASVTRNAGFSGANNLGAALARGRRLLLCNSDVLPARPGWLVRLDQAMQSVPSCGAVAPRLWYEDRSLQHAGMYFDRPGGDPWWLNQHYYKGLRGDFGPATAAREVPAVTGACMLVDTSVYRELGGLSERYVQGDFEDSDLCLRLRERGLVTWYAADVVAYHLEAMSYPSAMRTLVGRYNRWLHTQLWDDRITRLMADPRFQLVARRTRADVDG